MTGLADLWPYLIGVLIGLVIVVLIILLTPPWGRWS